MKKEEFQQNMKDRMQQFEDGGLRLLKKGQKGIVHAIFSRFGLVLLLIPGGLGCLAGVVLFGPWQCFCCSKWGCCSASSGGSATCCPITSAAAWPCRPSW